MKKQYDKGGIENLLEIMARLRDPEEGCPWDLAQTFRSIAPYTIEEAYEVADAIERDDLPALAVELGDLLLQVVYHARLGEEAGAFDFADVTRHICLKMVRRHPHVFSNERIESPEAQTREWEILKRREKESAGSDSLLDDLPVGLPGLTRAAKLGRRASSSGFDWPDGAGARLKVEEELAELDEALSNGDRDRIGAEMGDVFFALTNVCRHAGVDPEQCVRGANRRFESRFRHVEQRVKQSGRSFGQHTLDELDAYWREAKGGE
jgi:nucleoside triphosphate diphosphatase